MGKVYVVQENPRMDYAPAEQFGEVVFVTADEFSPVKGSIRNESIIDDLHRHLAKFDPESDWLVLTGNPVVMGYAFSLVYGISKRVKCLQWDRIRGIYREVDFAPTER